MNIQISPLIITTAAGQQMEVVNYKALLDLNADVYIIFGMRSFGKSYGILDYALKRWVDNRECFVMMRTIDDDIMQSKARKYIAGIKPTFNKYVDYEKELTVYGSDFIARSYNDKQVVREKVGSVMSLSGWLKYKGNNYDDVTTIIFEEFLERKPKITNEAFIDGYLNNLSTIIRLRNNVKVFCLANTVKKHSPIFEYYHIDLSRVKKGTPALFTESNGLRVCVYWTPDVKLDQESAKHYTVSDTKQAKMITHGDWESNDYPDKWLSFSATDCLKLKRFRLSNRFYLYDLSIYIYFPYIGDTPVLITKNTKQKPQHQILSIEFVLYYPNYYKILIKSVLSGKIVSDGKSYDEIDKLLSMNTGIQK